MIPVGARSMGEGEANWHDTQVRVLIDSPYGADLLAEDLAHQGHRALAAAMVAWGMHPEPVAQAIREEVAPADLEDLGPSAALIESVLMEHQAEGKTSTGATPEHGWATLCSCGYPAADMPAHQTQMIERAREDG